jgi:hypothetical protein
MSRKNPRSAPSARPALELDSIKPVSRRPMLMGLAVLSAAAIAYGVFNSQPALKQGTQAPRAAPATQSPVRTAPSLAAFQPVYDFGAISMAAGKVKHTYTVTNTGQAPVTIIGVQTSCMCTAATVVTSGGRVGPFGMAGHGRMPAIRETLAPGATAQVEAVFDPAAHGPAGVGRTERVIRIDTDSGVPLELGLVAMVRP